jgi:hypothetical protein
MKWNQRCYFYKGTETFYSAAEFLGHSGGKFFCKELATHWLQEMIDEADRDGDGEVNEDDFLRIMKKTGLY